MYCENSLFKSSGFWLTSTFTGLLLFFRASASIYMDAIRSIENASCLKPVPFFCDPAMVPRIEASSTLFDPDDRRAALQDMMAELHDLAPTLLLFPEIHTFAYDPAIGPMQFDGELLMLEAIRVGGEEGDSGS